MTADFNRRGWLASVGAAALASGLPAAARMPNPQQKSEPKDAYADYFRALGKATKRPVYIKTSGDAPKITPSVELIVDLAKEFPYFGYVKEEHDPVISRMKSLIAQR